jgi:hypothetical protein
MSPVDIPSSSIDLHRWGAVAVDLKRFPVNVMMMALIPVVSSGRVLIRRNWIPHDCHVIRVCRIPSDASSA